MAHAVFVGMLMAFVALFWAMGKLHKLAKGPRALVRRLFATGCSCRHRGSKHCRCPCGKCRMYKQHWAKKKSWGWKKHGGALRCGGHGSGSPQHKMHQALVPDRTVLPTMEPSKLDVTPVPPSSTCHGG